MNFVLEFPIKDDATSFRKTMALDNFDYDHPPNNGICVQMTQNYLTISILVWLNLLFLFIITLISFATYLDFKYSQFHIVFILFASILTITGSLLVFIWLHVLKEKKLIDSAMNKFQRRLMFTISLFHH